MKKQERLDELMVEYDKKNTLLQIVHKPYYKTGVSRKVVQERMVKYKQLVKDVDDLGEMIEEVFYGEG